MKVSPDSTLERLWKEMENARKRYLDTAPEAVRRRRTATEPNVATTDRGHRRHSAIRRCNGALRNYIGAVGRLCGFILNTQTGPLLQRR
jgi:hypothetical protein